ncbi:YrhK-like protein [Thalassobacillus cyri]|uniref:YrhK-like protein n=1 Tax=Thalassobacillus cyri TaxID=571932 RepID=A0A1H4FSG9_9BACI|nr:YrhK family protein [Thalassobacillus cyri]SEB00101.1 YrhK-like protein [Thalassobacillus cyri]
MVRKRKNHTILTLRKHRLYFEKPDELFYLFTQFLMGICFLAGSILFYFEAPIKHAGTSLFVLGSILILLHPSLHIFRKIHLSKKDHDEQK